MLRQATDNVGFRDAVRLCSCMSYLDRRHCWACICCLDRAVSCHCQPLLVVPLQLCSVALHRKAVWVRYVLTAHGTLHL